MAQAARLSRADPRGNPKGLALPLTFRAPAITRTTLFSAAVALSTSASVDGITTFSNAVMLRRLLSGGSAASATPGGGGADEGADLQRCASEPAVLPKMAERPVRPKFFCASGAKSNRGRASLEAFKRVQLEQLEIFRGHAASANWVCGAHKPAGLVRYMSYMLTLLLTH